MVIKQKCFFLLVTAAYVWQQVLTINCPHADFCWLVATLYMSWSESENLLASLKKSCNKLISLKTASPDLALQASFAAVVLCLWSASPGTKPQFSHSPECQRWHSQACHGSGCLCRIQQCRNHWAELVAIGCNFPQVHLDQQMLRSPSQHPSLQALWDRLFSCCSKEEGARGASIPSLTPSSQEQGTEQQSTAELLCRCARKGPAMRRNDLSSVQPQLLRSPPRRCYNQIKKKVLETPSSHWAFWFDVESCLGGLQYLCGVGFVWCWPGRLYITLKGCFLLVLVKKRTELKFLLPLGACSLNLVHYASESDCNFLLLSGLQEAECTADMCS